jgi:hypothetical protein
MLVGVSLKSTKVQSALIMSLFHYKSIKKIHSGYLLDVEFNYVFNECLHMSKYNIHSGYLLDVEFNYVFNECLHMSKYIR